MYNPNVNIKVPDVVSIEVSNNVFPEIVALDRVSSRSRSCGTGWFCAQCGKKPSLHEFPLGTKRSLVVLNGTGRLLLSQPNRDSPLLKLAVGALKNGVQSLVKEMLVAKKQIVTPCFEKVSDLLLQNMQLSQAPGVQSAVSDTIAMFPHVPRNVPDFG
jgi:hypothetical protein